MRQILFLGGCLSLMCLSLPSKPNKLVQTSRSEVLFEPTQNNIVTKCSSVVNRLTYQSLLCFSTALLIIELGIKEISCPKYEVFMNTLKNKLLQWIEPNYQNYAYFYSYSKLCKNKLYILSHNSKIMALFFYFYRTLVECF